MAQGIVLLTAVRVGSSARTPTIVTNVFRGFPQSLQAYLQSGHDHFLLQHFQCTIHCHLTSGCYKVWVADGIVK